jgi:hypothetical protein
MAQPKASDPLAAASERVAVPGRPARHARPPGAGHGSSACALDTEGREPAPAGGSGAVSGRRWLITLGTIGEDLGHVFNETKGRPIRIPERSLSRGAEAPPGTPADRTQAPAQARRPVQRGETT